jgi:dUTP pyrophosphatase
MAQIKVKKLNHFDNEFPLPRYETKDAAGADLRACFENKQDFEIKPGQRVLIPTGLSFEIQPGYEVQIRPRSGLSLKTNLLVVNSPGTIDADYRGEVKIIIGNFGNDNFTIKHGDRIAQMVLAPIHQAEFSVVDELSDTDRGAGGFGSTGV